jgi:hypothetical protein
MAEKNVAGSNSGDNRTRDGVSEGLLFHPLKPADWPEAMTGMGVRRDKAALSSGCKPHPAIRSSRKQSEQSWR